MKKVIIIILLAFLAGCAPRYVWVHPDIVSQDVIDIDTVQCDSYAQQEKQSTLEFLNANRPYMPPDRFGYSAIGNMGAVFGNIAAADSAYNRALNDCMHSRGYSLKEVKMNHTAATDKEITPQPKGNPAPRELKIDPEIKELINKNSQGGQP